MAKQVATNKQTSGAGFTFEDQVSAFYFLKMLSGTPVLRPEDGLIDELQFQKRVDGWFLDDLVLKLKNKSGVCINFAMSIKSNSQLSKNGFPKDFVEAIWEHRCHSGTNKFDVDNDYLSLVTASVDNNLKTAWNSLLKKSIDQDPSALPSRLKTKGYVNDIERAFFDSLKCPANIDDSKTDEDTAKLCSRIRHLDFDFEHEPSESQNYCITQCQAILSDSRLEIAESLWVFLKEKARELNSTGADISRTQLADKVRPYFSLKEFPVYEGDWKLLNDNSLYQIELISDKLGNTLSVDRKQVSNIPAKGLVALLGTSGCGKSSLAKSFVQSSYQDCNTLWMTPTTLNAGPLNLLLKELEIKSTLPFLLENSQTQKGIIVVDAAEQLNEQGLENVASIIKSGRLGEEDSPWNLLLSCVNDNWESVYNSLKRKAKEIIEIHSFPVSVPFKDISNQVIKSFPKLTKTLSNPNLRNLFNNLKILDLVVSYARDTTDSNNWIGETDVLEWYWDNHIAITDEKIARSRFLQKLGKIEADKYTSQISIHDLDSGESGVASGLVDDHVLWNENEKLGFKHELIGDWARLRHFVSTNANIENEIKAVAANPRWHRAIRLYGMRLLENSSIPHTEWTGLFSRLAPEYTPKLESDLILDAVIFSSNAHQSLLDSWEELEKNNGYFLKRMLNRFLHVATLPHPRLEGEYFRYPYWPLWPAMLKAIYQNRLSIIKIAPDEVTRIAQLWLQFSVKRSILRSEASQILLDTVGLVIKKENGEEDWDNYISRDVIYERLPSAIVGKPNETKSLLIKLVERHEQSLFNESKTVSRSVFKSGPLGKEWIDGPKRRIDHSVKEGLLRSTWDEVINEDPSLAKELILALLIREPLPDDYDEFMSTGDHFVHLDDCRDWYPSMYFKGPFLKFLNMNPEKGIETIIELINFATARWIEKFDPDTIQVSISGTQKILNGNMRVFFWYRDPPWQDNVIVCALMALEKWLYNLIDKKQDASFYINKIIAEATSVAIFGVLACVGRRHPVLFESELAEIIPIWRFQVWEDEYRFSDQELCNNMSMTSWARYSEEIWNLVRDWHALEHRKKNLGDCLFIHFITNSSTTKQIELAYKQWEAEFSILKSEDSEEAENLERILLRFNRQNWTSTIEEDQIRIEYNEPEGVTEEKAEARNEADRNLRRVSFHLKCRQLHDKGESLEETALLQFWEELRLLAKDMNGSEPESQSSVNAGIAGGTTFLLTYHRTWLEKSEDRLETCWRLLGEVIANPPQRPDYFNAISSSNYHWNNFLALFLPAELARHPDSEDFRFLIVDLAFSNNHTVVQDIVESMFLSRDKNYSDFLRIQRMVLISTCIRSVFSATAENSIWRTPNIKVEVEGYLHLLEDSFVERKTSTDIPSLQKMGRLAVAEIFRMVKKQWAYERILITDDTLNIVPRRIAKCNGFDVDLIRVSFDWLKRIDQEDDIERRELWINTVSDFIAAFLEPLGGTEGSREDEEADSHFMDRSIPSQGEHWIFDLISTVAPKLTCEEEPELLWKPIIELGLERPHWVKYFLTSWFHTNKQNGFTEGFFREWRKMIHYANSLPLWRSSELSRGRYGSEDLFGELMGMSDYGVYCIEDEKHRSHINSLKNEYHKWADEFLCYPESLAKYAVFLCAPSATDLLNDGLEKLYKVVPSLGAWAWKEHYHTESSLMNFLEYYWDKQFDSVKRDSVIKEQFMTILKTLSDRQYQRALELQDQIAREP